MNDSSLTLTVIFDPPFYKAIFEDCQIDSYRVATLNLGTSEPPIQSIYQFVLHRWN